MHIVLIQNNFSCSVFFFLYSDAVQSLPFFRVPDSCVLIFGRISVRLRTFTSRQHKCRKVRYMLHPCLECDENPQSSSPRRRRQYEVTATGGAYITILKVYIFLPEAWVWKVQWGQFQIRLTPSELQL
jgi:hypothetical protein